MKTKISIILQSVLIMLAVGWLASVQACADLTIFGRMTTDLSNATIDGKPITSRQQSQIGKIPVFANPFDTTLYQSGTKLKIVSQVSTCIRYIDEKKLIVLLPATKRYMTATLSSYASGPLFKDAQTTVVDMNKTKSILDIKRIFIQCA